MDMKRKRDSIASARASQRGKLVGRRRVDEAKSQELEPSFADLPLAIISHIMLQLPFKSLLTCKCVCKTWKEVISDPHFVRMHFERAPVCVLIRTKDSKLVSRTLHLFENQPKNYDDEKYKFCYCEDDFLNPKCNNHVKPQLKFKLPLRDAKSVLNKRYEAKNPSGQRGYTTWKPKYDKFEVVNSCNGILCLRGPGIKDPLVVCNPITGEYIRLPETCEIDKTQVPTRYFYVGFGFQPKTNEYKVIKLWQRDIKCLRYNHGHGRCFKEQNAEIHTLGTPTWRNVGVDPTLRIERLAFPTYLNGALHWIKFNLMPLETSILCFNFESERFQTFLSPPGLFENNRFSESKYSMGEVRGFLYICNSSSDLDSLTIWIMEKYGIEGSWIKVFSIHQFAEQRWLNSLYLPVVLFKAGAGILMYHSCRCFNICKSEMLGFKFYKVRGAKSKFEVIPHIPSLISLKDAVKGDGVEVLNVHSQFAKLKWREENEVLFLAQLDIQLASL